MSTTGLGGGTRGHRDSNERQRRRCPRTAPIESRTMRAPESLSPMGVEEEPTSVSNTEKRSLRQMGRQTGRKLAQQTALQTARQWARQWAQ